MEQKYIISSAVLGGALGIMIAAPGFPTAAAFTSTCALFGFLQFLDRERLDQIERFEREIKTLKDQFESFKIGRGMGR